MPEVAATFVEQVVLELRKDFAALDQRDRARFQEAVAAFVEDLNAKHGFRPGLRVKGVKVPPASTR